MRVCHPREDGDPWLGGVKRGWIPAYAGMTGIGIYYENCYFV